MNLTLTLWIQKWSTDWSEKLKPKRREEDFEKRPTSATKSWNAKGQLSPIQETPVISEKLLNTSLNKKTNIPCWWFEEKRTSQLINLASDLKAHVIGQNDAADKITKAIRRNRRPRIA